MFSIKNHPSVERGKIAFGMPQRKWAQLALDQDLEVQPVQLGQNNYIGGITLEADFQNKKRYFGVVVHCFKTINNCSATTEPLDSDAMAREFSMSFSGQAFTVGMLLVFRFTDAKSVTRVLALTVKNMECTMDSSYKRYYSNIFSC